jgi:hypothetical protein
MSVSELFATIQSLPRPEQIELYQRIHEELCDRDFEPLPEGSPPPEDGCPSTREELEWLRRQPGIYTTEEVLRSLGQS